MFVKVTSDLCSPVGFGASGESLALGGLLKVSWFHVGVYWQQLFFVERYVPSKRGVIHERAVR